MGTHGLKQHKRNGNCQRYNIATPEARPGQVLRAKHSIKNSGERSRPRLNLWLKLPSAQQPLPNLQLRVVVETISNGVEELHHAVEPSKAQAELSRNCLPN